MARHRELQEALKKDIIKVLATLQNRYSNYQSHIAVKGSIAVTVDEKRLFVIKLQKQFSKVIHHKNVSSHGKNNKLQNTSISPLDEVQGVDLFGNDSTVHGKGKPLLSSLPQDDNLLADQREDHTDCDGVDSDNSGITEDYLPEVKREVDFEELVPIEALNFDVANCEMKNDTSPKKFGGSRTKRKKSTKKESREQVSNKSDTVVNRNQDNLQCGKCLEQFLNKKTLVQHICSQNGSMSKRGARYRSRQAVKLNDKDRHLLECVGRGKSKGVKKKQTKLSCQQRQEGAIQSFYCFICHMPFQNRHSLDKHEIANHLPDEGHPFKCASCGAKFGCAAHLNRHKRSHTDKETFLDYVCKECDMRFEREASLKKHQSTHVPRTKLYACQYCEDQFCTQYEMRTHMEDIHEKSDRKYMCSSCNEMFKTADEKKEHPCVAIFKEEETKRFPFLCEVCWCSYDSENSLTLHRSSGENCLRLKNGDIISNNYCVHCNIDYGDENAFKTHSHVDRPEEGRLAMYRCRFCGLLCEDGTALTKHEETFHIKNGEFLFHCPICQKSHQTRASLLAHINGHKDSNSSNDEITHNSSSTNLVNSRNVLSKYRRRKTGNANKGDSFFPCKTCHEKFDSQQEVYCHGEISHLEKHMTYMCGVCACIFTQLTDLHIHENNTHEDLPPMACFICGLRFGSQSLLDEHLNGAECSTCHTKFLAHCQLKHHTEGLVMAKRKQEVPYCIPCGKSFSSHVSLMLHERRSHQSIDGHPFKCNKCGRRFGNMTHLRRHLLIHTNTKPFLCDHCGKSFRSERSRSIHDKLFHHDGESHRFQCSVCSKKFGSQQNLDRHELVHSGFKPHLCVTCGRRFKSKETLRDHDRRLHQSKFEFSCQTCGHGFKSEFKLQLHVLMHQQHTDFKCQKCNDKFSSMADLMGHHNRQHPEFVSEKKVQCGICGARYPDTNQLQHHQSSHLPTKMFRCEMCEATFQHKTSLFRHRNRRCPNRKDAKKNKSAEKAKVPRARVKSSSKRATNPDPLPPPLLQQPLPDPTQREPEQQVILGDLRPIPLTTTASTEVVTTGNIPIVLHGLQDSLHTGYNHLSQMPLEVPIPQHPTAQGQTIWEPHLGQPQQQQQHVPPQPQQQNMMHFHTMSPYRHPHPSHPPPPPHHPYAIGQQFHPLQLLDQSHLQPR